MSKQNVHAIVMPTEACNLACVYCYVLEKSAERMSIPLAEHVVDELLNYNAPDQPTKIIWHGGEPLLAGMDFYKHICSYIHKHYPEHVVQHFIQTNGVLLNDEWIDFFLEEKFNVGVSLDGWKELHDACRKFYNGQGTFDKIFQNILHARSKGLIAGVLSVVTRHTVGHEKEFFDFFCGHKLDFGFHPITPLSPWMNQELAITPEEFAEVSVKLFDLGFFQPEPRVTSVTPTLHYAMAVMMGYPSGFCVLSENCAAEYLSIEPTGRVQACDRFAGNMALTFGNIATNSLREILDSPVRQEFLERWQVVSEKCTGCEWASICYGGCPHEAYAKTGSIFEPDPNCEAYKRIFSHISNTIARELEKAGNKPSEDFGRVR